ncbi:MAG: mechanosensitive ion channel domain-containing protein [Opitutaceae bacterium]
MHFSLQGDILHQILATAVLVGLILLFQLAGNRWINNRQFRSSTYRRRWIVGMRNLRLLILVVGLILIWATELRTAAISAVAIMAALVIGTKELIMCVLGSIVKAGSNAFALGDRIRVGTVEGDVIDQSLLSTQLHEVQEGQYSGQTVSIPNSQFLSQAIHNSTIAGGGAVYGMLTVKLARSDDWSAHETALLSAAETCCAATKDGVNKIIDRLKRDGIDLPSTELRTLIHIEDKETLSITLRYPASAEAKLKVEQAILRDYLNRMQNKQAMDEAAT